MGFKTRLPYDHIPHWKEFRSKPLDEQRRLLEIPSERALLVKAATEAEYATGPVTVSNPIPAPNYDAIRVLQDPVGPNPTLAEVARQRGVHPVECLIDLSLRSNFDMFFSHSLGRRTDQDVLSTLNNPRSIMTFTDSGAHVGYVMESSIQTYFLAYWVRQQEEFNLERAVQMLTLAPARAWGFSDRGLLREGLVADLNVFDPAIIAPAPLTYDWDLPGGAGRLQQRSTGFKATVVAGQTTLLDGKHTGAMPGRFLRKGVGVP
jgi:N-acyl-D-aspartate/D-glutamate deacylase